MHIGHNEGLLLRVKTLHTRSSIQNFFDVSHPVQDANDLNRVGVRVVDDEVGVDGPEFHWLVREVLAGVADSSIAAEKFKGAVDLLKNLAGNIRGPTFSTR